AAWLRDRRTVSRRSVLSSTRAHGRTTGRGERTGEEERLLNAIGGPSMIARERLAYQVVEGWEQLPVGFTHQDCVGVDVDSQDNVYLFTRGQARVFVYSRDGAYLRSWGEELFTPRTHGLTVG